MHPFSPKGKLVHFGLDALDVAVRLVGAASAHRPACVLRPNLFRVALTTESATQLRRASEQFPHLATWLSAGDVHSKLGMDMDASTSCCYGGLEMGNGCGVIHVPTYLEGLLRECEARAADVGGSVRWEVVRYEDAPPPGSRDDDDGGRTTSRRQGDDARAGGGMGAKNEETSSIDDDNDDDAGSSSWDDVDAMNRRLGEYDAVILCAGAGMLRDGLVGNDGERRLPVQLVRGQSIEMTLPTTTTTTTTTGDESYGGISNEAVLCGKYVSPLPSNYTTSDDPASSSSSSSYRRYVIGATHEFKDDPLTPEEVIDELKSRTYDLAKGLWDRGTVDRLTSGVRLQTNRGRFGRMPMVGRYRNDDDGDGSGGSSGGVSHRNSWIFAGLSSRGLIYHGLFGSWLADAVLQDDEERLRDEFADFDWWRTTR